MATKARGKSAWLVTWHWMRDHPKREVAAIFSSRLGGVRVKEFVELIWVTSKYFTFEEKLSMKWPGGRTPYAARFGQTKEGVPWSGEVVCGNDPFLRARVVDDVTIQRDADGKEQVNWKERPRASSDWILTEHGVSLRQDAGNDEQHGQDDEGDPDAVTE